MLMPPKPKKLLKLYLSVTKGSSGYLLAQDNGYEQAVFYLSRLLQGLKVRYTNGEKWCLSLYWTPVKLRHYFMPHQVVVLEKSDLVKYMLSQPLLRGRLSKWSVYLMQFDTAYVS